MLQKDVTLVYMLSKFAFKMERNTYLKVIVGIMAKTINRAAP